MYHIIFIEFKKLTTRLAVHFTQTRRNTQVTLWNQILIITQQMLVE